MFILYTLQDILPCVEQHYLVYQGHQAQKELARFVIDHQEFSHILLLHSVKKIRLSYLINDNTKKSLVVSRSVNHPSKNSCKNT